MDLVLDIEEEEEGTNERRSATSIIPIVAAKFTREGLLELISTQIDLELVYKNQERVLLRKCIEYSQEMLELISQLLYIEAVGSEPSPLLSHPLRKRKMERITQYEILSDGSFVKLVCPICKEELFANILGLKNHCRIRHGLELYTREDCISKCGIPVDVSQVPPSFFETRERILTSEMQLAKLTSVDAEHFSSTVDTSADESRFYLNKKIVIGSFVKKLVLADEHMSPDGIPYSYKWKLFVNGPPEDMDIHLFIKSVKFSILESGEEVQVHRPPFLVSRYAIGSDAIVKVEIFFHNDASPCKEIDVGIPFDKAKYSTYTLSFQKEYTCALDRRVSLYTLESWEKEYLPEIEGIKNSVVAASSTIAKEQTEKSIFKSKKKILKPHIRTIMDRNNSVRIKEETNLCRMHLEAAVVKNYPKLTYFKRAAKRISPLELDSMLRILFPAVFPLWCDELKLHPFYYYSIARSSEEFFDTWSFYKRSSVLLIWAKNISLAAKYYWKLQSPIPISQTLHWVNQPLSELLKISCYRHADRVVQVINAVHDNVSNGRGVAKYTDTTKNTQHSKEYLKDLIVALQDGSSTIPQNQWELESLVYCRYCGRPFPLDSLSIGHTTLLSHYKRCLLRPVKNDISTILHSVPPASHLNFSSELWRDFEFQRYWFARNTIFSPIELDTRWIWENLPNKKNTGTILVHLALLNPENGTFDPIGRIFSRVSFSNLA